MKILAIALSAIVALMPVALADESPLAAKFDNVNLSVTRLSDVEVDGRTTPRYQIRVQAPCGVEVWVVNGVIMGPFYGENPLGDLRKDKPSPVVRVKRLEIYRPHKGGFFREIDWVGNFVFGT